MASAGWGDATTNQKSAETMGYLLGRMARRAMAIGDEDAVASFVPSDFGAKIKNMTKFVVGIGGRQSTTARNNQPNLCWSDGGEIGEDA